MSFLLRIASPVTLKLSSPPHQISSCSPFGKHATLAVALADPTNAPGSQATSHNNHLPPIVIYPYKKIKPFTADAQRLALLAQLLAACDISSDTKDNGTANPDTCPKSTADRTSFVPSACSSSIFPVLGPFDLLHCIQKGAFGVAWAARDKGTGRLLCLKAFQSLHNPDIAKSVRTELKLFRRMVKSKGGKRGKQFLIELNRSIQHHTTVFFAMELMTVDLAIYLFTEPERCRLHSRRWMAQITLGIEALHEMGILHRDIKSENILIDSRENVRIIDFGLSYLDPAGEPLLQGVGYATDCLGTPQYMAPEILRNDRMPSHRRRSYGTAVDWWALGCILYELESQDHQPLFDTDAEVHAYVAWTQRPDKFEETYPKFQGLEPVALDLVEGLLEVHPSTRYSFCDLERHDYFQLHDKTEFDDAAARALERPVHPELVPQFTWDHGPVEVVEAATSRSIYDWTNLKWACVR